MVRRGLMKAGLLGAALTGLCACNESALSTSAVDGGEAVAGLTAEQASKVIAKVGDHAITLGDFARSLERMDKLDRLRYQSKDRRRELLTELINVELLAQEARRRGLDKQAESQDQVRWILRDAMIAQTRADVPPPAGLPAEEVHAYFEANQDKFNEPERRRVAAIVMSDKKEAKKVLDEALKVKTPEEWGELFFKHSLNAPKKRGVNSPADLAGDLGTVGPLGDPRGGAAKVPEPVRAAVFQLSGVGAVSPELLEFEGKQYIVRMNGFTAAHQRQFAEAERSIRVMLVQQKMQEKEQALEEALRKKFPIVIDDKALAGVPIPPSLEKPDVSGASPMANPRQGPPREAAVPGDAGAPHTDGGR